MSWTDSAFTSPTLAGSAVKIDPTAPGTVFRRAAALEAIFNFMGGAMMVLYPSELLGLMVRKPSRDIAPAGIQLMQWLGALTWALTPQLILAIPNTRGAIESRRTVYWTLFSGEGLLIPLILWQARGKDGGFTAKALVGVVSVLVTPMLWRLVLLLAKPAWFGRYRDQDASKKVQERL